MATLSEMWCSQTSQQLSAASGSASYSEGLTRLAGEADSIANTTTNATTAVATVDVRDRS